MRIRAQIYLGPSNSGSEDIRTEAQHCVPLRMNPNFSDASFHIRSIPYVLSISAADVNTF